MWIVIKDVEIMMDTMQVKVTCKVERNQKMILSLKTLSNKSVS